MESRFVPSLPKANRVLAVLALLTAPVLACAEDGDWHGRLIFDGWMFLPQGSVTVRGQEQQVNTSFKTIFDSIGKVSSFLAGQGEIAKGPWRFLLNGFHIGVGTSAKAGAGVDIDVKLELLEGALAYRVEGDATGRDGYFDLLVGPRWFNMDLKLKGRGALGIESGEGKDTLQAFVGVRGDHKVTDHWHWNYRFDVGGFQHDSNSFQAYGGFMHVWDNNWFANVGVRALNLNYDEGSGERLFKHRLSYVGPQFGGGWNF